MPSEFSLEHRRRLSESKRRAYRDPAYRALMREKLLAGHATKRANAPTRIVSKSRVEILVSRLPKDHPMYAPEHRRVAEARAVMAAHIRRRLTSREQVHHANGDPLDNRIENLVLCRGWKQHMDMHRFGTPA